MIHIRDEGQTVHQGINIYPLESNQLGFLLRIKNFNYFARYNKKLKVFKFYRG